MLQMHNKPLRSSSKKSPANPERGNPSHVQRLRRRIEEVGPLRGAKPSRQPTTDPHVRPRRACSRRKSRSKRPTPRRARHGETARIPLEGVSTAPRRRICASTVPANSEPLHGSAAESSRHCPAPSAPEPPRQWPPQHHPSAHRTPSPHGGQRMAPTRLRCPRYTIRGHHPLPRRQPHRTPTGGPSRTALPPARTAVSGSQPKHRH